MRLLMTHQVAWQAKILYRNTERTDVYRTTYLATVEYKQFRVIYKRI